MNTPAYPRRLDDERVMVKIVSGCEHVMGRDELMAKLSQLQAAADLMGWSEKEWLERSGDEIHANKLRHDWKVTTSEDWADLDEIPAVLMQIVAELAEALEAFRRDDRRNFEEELADAMIRTIGLAHGMGIDLKAAILAKVEKNRHRPIRHGGKRI